MAAGDWPQAPFPVLRHGHWALELDPDTGGAVRRLRCHGFDVLRPAAAGRRTPLEMAAFPLVPFAGRIAHGSFRFDGRDVRLPANLGDEPHAIHGDGWQNAWQVEDADTAEASLTFEHTPGPWPWHYRARQHFLLNDTALVLTLELVNLDERPMPAGLGWHPYFNARGARLRADVRRHWPWSSDLSPAGPEPLTAAIDLRAWRAAAGLDLDHVFEGGSGAAELCWPDLSVTLQASPELGFLVVYAPPAADYCCVEPISHVPDAVNNPRHLAETGLRVLEPGAALRARVRLSIVPRAEG